MISKADRNLINAVKNLFEAAQYLESPQYQEDLRREEEARQATLNREKANLEFREEVIDAICETGIARHVAANMTATEVNLLSNARKFGVI